MIKHLVDGLADELGAALRPYDSVKSGKGFNGNPDVGSDVISAVAAHVGPLAGAPILTKTRK